MGQITGITSVHNIRDLGGMKTAQGKTIREGKLIRSGHLSELKDDEAKMLSGLVGAVVDFRSDEEQKRQPDTSIEGVKYYHLPAVPSLSGGISREEESDRRAAELLINKPSEARAYMLEMYRNLAVSEQSSGAYASFVHLILEQKEKAVLWHCTAGKDRAGCAAAIVEKLLGVSQEDIIADYLLTNTLIRSDIDRLNRFLMAQAHLEEADMDRAQDALGYLFGAKKEYIEAFFDNITQKYGGFDSYAKEALGLDEAAISALRSRLLED